MWAEYRKRFIITQLMILVLAGVLHFAQHYSWRDTLTAFLILQIFAFLGARWSIRMKRKLLAERPLLKPL